MEATVHFDTQFNAGAIDRRIFGGFLEHLGRAVYEGVYDPGNPLSDERGFRRDVLDALRQINMPIVRYPGGNFVSCYDWRDGVGPVNKRPARPDYAWRSVESNQFGTDEFLAWCRALNTSAMMAVNLGTLGTAAAGELLEYCNLPVGTYWADRRRQNGRTEPHGVKLWCLGNEMDGPWQAGHVPADEYARRALQASTLMKGMDPTIETIACGSSGRFMKTYLQWDRTVLEYCWHKIDYISAHRYSNNDRQDSAWYLAEGVEIDRILNDYAGLLDYVRGVTKSNRRVYLSFDEWNVWYKDRGGDGQWATAPHLLEEVYNFEDALVCAQYLNSFIRRADLVKIACVAQVVNVIAPVLTRGDGLLLQSIYWPLLLYSRHATGVSLNPAIDSPDYRAGERGDVPAIDVSASYDAAAKAASVFIVNRTQASAASVAVDFADMNVVRIIGADGMGGVDLKQSNQWGMPASVGLVSVKTTLQDGQLHVTVPGPGLAVVRLELAGK